MANPSASMLRRSQPQKFHVAVNIINLDKDKKRYESVTTNLTEKADVPPEDIFRYPAIYGKALDDDELRANTTVLGSLVCTRGMIGCFMSHRNLWLKIRNEDLPYQMILEDDVVVPADFYARVEALMDHLEDCEETREGNWDVLLLGAFLSVAPGRKTFPVQAFMLGGERVPRMVTQFLHVPHRPLGAHAYILSKRGAEKLLKRAYKASHHVDAVAWGDTNLKLFLSHPMLAFQDMTHCSTVGGITEGVEASLPRWSMDSYTQVPFVWYMNEPFFRLPVLNVVITIFRYWGVGILSMFITLYFIWRGQLPLWAILLHLGAVTGPGFVITRIMMLPSGPGRRPSTDSMCV